MKVLITGANGLLGSNIVRQMINENYEIKILARKSSDLSGIEGLKFEICYGDICNENDLVLASRDCEIIVHAAANTNQFPTDYKHYEKINVQGTKNVLSAAKINKISKVIYVSTANVFGFGTKQNPGTELTEFNSFKYNSGYIISKYIAQQQVLMEVEKNKVPVVIVNPTFMIGEYDAKPSSGKIILMSIFKKVQFYPSGGKNFVHVRDVAVGVCNAIKYGKIGESYLLANENLSYREFFEKENKATNHKSIKIKIPALLIKTVGLFGTIFEKLTGKPAKLNLVNARLLCIENYYSSQKAVRELKIPQTPIDEAITDAIKWFKENGKLIKT